MRKPNWEKIILSSALFVLITSALYVTVMLAIAPSVSSGEGARVKSDYLLMLLQSLLGIAAMMLPGLIEHRLRLKIPSKMMIVYVLFLFGAIYLGEIRDFYYRIPYWDTILHTLSGGMLGALGFSIVALLNKTDRVSFNLSAGFVAIFAFCFAVTMGVFWEIYEFAMDGLLGFNMQKFALRDGSELVGRAALSDTMVDLIVDCLGALVITISGYLSMVYKTGWLERLLLKRKK